MLVNLVNDLPLIRDYVAGRIRAQAGVGAPISAIEVGFRLDQACLVALHFDTRAEHAPDGTWAEAFDDAPLELPHWNEAYEASCRDGISFVLPTGQTRDVPASAGEEAVAAVFGETLLAVVTDGIAAGSFAALPLRDDCQLEAEEFDGMWAWPNVPFNPEATDRPNEIRRLPPTRLPE